MLLECRGDWAAAQAVYDAILEKQPAHEGAHKRKVAILRRASRRRGGRALKRRAADASRGRARGRLAEAAACLVTLLDTWQSDLEAWAELGELYLALGAPRQAAFCIEELLAAAPGAAPWHCWYASVQATLGDADGLRLASKHYAAAIELSGGHDVRALYGAVAVARLAPAEELLGGAAAARLRQLYAAQADARVAALATAVLGKA
jgi:tetratricopeptide (TPR) repeat protein